MLTKKVDWLNEIDSSQYLKENKLYYSLQGRLGNQLFGLSEAFQLHKKFSKNIVIDFSEVIHSGFSKPTWIPFVDYAWAEFVYNSSYSAFKNNVKFINLGFCNLKKVTKDKYFSGFSVKYSDLCRSGLFEKGVFPFRINEITSQTNFTVISVRAGDYVKNPHLGILPFRYYKKAYNSMHKLNTDVPNYLFSDDILKAQKMLKKAKIRINYIQEKKYSDLENLFLMSKGSNHIIGNSTFSYWAAFFSNGKTYFPNPFYIGDSNFHNDLFWPEAKSVTYTRFPKARYFLNKIKYKVYKARFFK